MVQVRRFVKSFKKFSNPMRRLDTVAQDADLRDKAPGDLRKLGETIVERCEDAMRDYGTQKETEKNNMEANADGRCIKLLHVISYSLCCSDSVSYYCFFLICNINHEHGNTMYFKIFGIY